MEQFDLSKGIKKYVKEAQWVIPLLSLSVLATFISFAVLILFWIMARDVITPLILMCVFALCSVALFLRYGKNSKHYYFFSYIDAFPDMGAPLNVLIFNNYHDRLKSQAEELGFTEVETSFLKNRQVFHLDVRAKAPNGSLMSAVFETEKATVYNLSLGTNATLPYDDFLQDRQDDKAIMLDCLLLILSASKETEDNLHTRND